MGEHFCACCGARCDGPIIQYGPDRVCSALCYKEYVKEMRKN